MDRGLLEQYQQLPLHQRSDTTSNAYCGKITSAEGVEGLVEDLYSR